MLAKKETLKREAEKTKRAPFKREPAEYGVENGTSRKVGQAREQEHGDHRHREAGVKEEITTNHKSKIPFRGWKKRATGGERSMTTTTQHANIRQVCAIPTQRNPTTRSPTAIFLPTSLLSTRTPSTSAPSTSRAETTAKAGPEPRSTTDWLQQPTTYVVQGPHLHPVPRQHGQQGE